MLGVFQLADFLQGPGEGFKGFHSGVLQDFALAREAHGAAGAGKQGNPYLVFQFLDLVTDGSGGNAHVGGSAGKA